MPELSSWSAMELKVWVDGIQRVISGVSETTTCQDVVIALAHAMGRTGRFTLVEKWRDTERPLVPAEFPLQVLQKWGEYAGEVRLFLKQSDLDKHKSDGSSKSSGGSHAKHKDKFLLHNFSPPTGMPESTSVRRSSTFSGAHKSSALSQPRLSKQPVAHPRKNVLPHSVQNGGVGTGMGAPTHPSSSLHSLSASGSSKTSLQGVLPSQRLPPRPSDQDRTSSKASVIGDQHFTNSPRGSSVSKPVPAPRGSPVIQSGGGVPVGEGSRDGSLPRRTSPSNRTSSPQGVGGLGPSHLRRFSPSRSSGAFFLEEGESASPFSRVTSMNRGGPLVFSGSGGKGGVVPPFPRGRLSTVDSGEAEELKLDAPPIQPKLITNEIEEYDLDQNFPDTPRDWGKGPEHPGGHTEYRLDGTGEEDKGVVEVDAEKVRLLRTVNLQQERFKLQESQISIVDTELQSLEEKAKEREEEARKASQEQQELEEKCRTFETELTELEATAWEERLKEQEQQEKELKEQLADLREKLQRVQDDLAAYQEKEQELEKQVQAAKTQRQQDEERKKRQEEIVSKQLEETKRELAAMATELEPKEKELAEVEKQVQELEEELKKKKQEAETLEQSLKDGKLPELNVSPPPSPAEKTSTTPSSSGEAILKILEGRLSPRPGSTGKPGSPSQQQQQQQAFISALNSKNPNGVWV